MLFQLSDPTKTKELVAAFMLLAYEACETETGMGFLQAVNNLTMDAVWRYIASFELASKPGYTEYYSDYIAGRMVYAEIAVDPNGVIHLSDAVPTLKYQGWAKKFNTYEALLRAACERIDMPRLPAENSAARAKQHRTATDHRAVVRKLHPA